MPSTPNLNPPASSVAVHAPVYCDPLRAGTPGKDKNDSERGREQVKCVTSRAEAEFRGALDRRLALELTREPGERVGVMLEDGGAVEAVTVAGSDRNEPEWRRRWRRNSFGSAGKACGRSAPGVDLATSWASRYRCAYSATRAACWVRTCSFRRTSRGFHRTPGRPGRGRLCRSTGHGR